MTGWRFILSARWAGYFALVVVFAIASCLLGNWQFERRAEARIAIDLVAANYELEPEAVDQVLPSLDAFDAGQQWTPVLLEGRYLIDDELLVRNRPYSGHPGFEVLTPLQLKDGTIFIVNRGWVSVGSKQDAPDLVPAAPEGEVTVVARLKAGEPVLEGRGAPAGTNQIATINLEQVGERLGSDAVYTGAFGLVASQDPEPASTPITPLKPEPDEGPHLSYALQWYVFALLAFIGLGWALLQEYRVVNASDPDEQLRAQERERRRALKAPSDADIEDAIIGS